MIENECFLSFFAEAHQYLTKSLPTDLKSCKSRLLRHDMFYLGDGSVHNAFMHLGLNMLSGRSEEKKQLITQGLLRLLQKHFNASKGCAFLQFSVEVNDLSRHYLKDEVIF